MSKGAKLAYKPVGLLGGVLAAALQGAVFAATRTAIDRAGANGFRRLTGAWPGD